MFKDFLFRKAGRVLLVPILAVLFSALSFAQVLDNKGSDFIFGFMPNLNAPTIEVHITGDVATNVTVDYPVNSPTFTTTVAVNPGSVTIVTIPATSAQNWNANTVQNNAVRVYSDNEFVSYLVNRSSASSDAALGLPVDVMNTEYLVLTYMSTLVSQDRSEFLVVAAFNNTEVTITPTNAMVGHAAGVPFTVTLNRGEGYLGQGTTNGPNGDLTGTVIKANKPIGLNNGNLCTNVPPNTSYCDHIFEIAQPTQTWGNQVLVSNLPNRPNGSVYRVLASLDNTEIELDGVNVASLNRGEFYETQVIPGSHIFSANNPIYVAQFMTGDSYPNADQGDPAMGNMIPSEQYLQSYTFSTVGNNQFVRNFVTIIAQNSDVGTLILDGSPIPAGDFSPIAGSSFSSVLVEITSGTHQTASLNGHGITVEGINNFDSYIYPGGARFQFINPVGDANPPICEVTIDNNQANGTATDSRSSEDVNNNGILDPGEDLNNNGQIDTDTGIFFVVLQNGAQNLTLTVDPFTPGEGSVSYTATLTDPNLVGSGTVVVTDGAGNTCSTFIELGEGEPDPFPFMTFWGVNDENDGKLYWFTLAQGFDFSNIEGDILGITGEKDIEDLAVANDGWVWIVNNIGASTIYKIDPAQFDKNPATPVTAELVGSTGLVAHGVGEIASLHVMNGTLYGLGKETKKVYTISTTDGSVTDIADLNVAGDFRTDGLTLGADDVWYLIKTSLTDESELWKFESFPDGPLSLVTVISTSNKVEALSAHPNGNLYAADDFNLFEIDLAGNAIGALSAFTLDVEGLDFNYEAEVKKPAAPTLQFTIVGAVPVELTSFTFSTNKNNVTLNWTTATETNNKGFFIERAEENKPFSSVGFINGVGNSTTKQSYSYTDKLNSNGGMYTYRLKQVDFDGTFKYSQTIEVSLQPVSSYELAQNFPNPFNPTTVIRYTVPEATHVKLTVINTLGETVATLVNEVIEAGIHEKSFEAGNLPSGVYIYRIETSGYTHSQKMMLMK